MLRSIGRKRSSPAGFRSACLVVFCYLVLAIGVASICGCSQNASGQAKKNNRESQNAIPVTVGSAVEKTVPVQLRAIGKAQAYAVVSVKPQVAGELTVVHFKEGQEVKKGDLLFTIDPRPFEAQLKKAEATLAKDKAQLQNARKQTERYGAVVKKGFVSEEVHDQVRTNAIALEASVRAGEAAVESAKVELAYCYIRSPINGVTGELKVHQGNLLKEKDTENPLVTINQTSPIYVSFSVPEQFLSEVKSHMAVRRLEVLALLPGDEKNPVRGELAFFDNKVDANTGTIQLKAIFPNNDKALWPGQFVNAVLTLAEQSNVVVVPSQAIQVGQHGRYAFVVKPDSTVEYRLVTAGRSINGEIVIEKGIAPGEKVVIDGQLRLAQGTRIKVVDPESGDREGNR